MKRFMAGLLLGLTLSAVPSGAEWYSDQFDRFMNRLTAIQGTLNRIAVALERSAPPPKPLPAEAEPSHTPGCRSRLGAIVPCGPGQPR